MAENGQMCSATVSGESEVEQTLKTVTVFNFNFLNYKLLTSNNHQFLNRLYIFLKLYLENSLFLPSFLKKYTHRL